MLLQYFPKNFFFFRRDHSCFDKLSLLSGAHNVLFPKIAELLRRQGGEEILIFAGGIVPPEDIPRLKSSGIAEVFGPGTSTQEIVRFLKQSFRING